MNSQLTDKFALITGGAGLLGEQHAKALAEAGATVVITDVNKQAVEKSAKKLSAEFSAGKILGIEMDVTLPDSVQSVQDLLGQSISTIDILINNAAVNPAVKGQGGPLETSRLENFPLDQWNHQIDVGLTGAFICSKIFGATMADNGGGVILNIASDLSVIAPDQRLYRVEGVPDDEQPVKPVTYSVIKTGLIGLTRYLATYWADKNVRVNALSPGGVYTDEPDTFVSKLNRLIPMGRMANIDEYKKAVVFLVSDSSSYMTGQNIVMDGGRSVW